MRTPMPIWVDGLDGRKAEQVLSGWISLSDAGLPTELCLVVLRLMRCGGRCHRLHPPALPVVLSALGQQGPGGTHILVGQRDRRFTVTRPLDQVP